MRLQGFDGRVALVTGAAGGIGRRVTETFLALGARVVAFDLTEPDIPGAVGIAMDVTDVDSVAAATARAEVEAGPASIFSSHPPASSILRRSPRSDSISGGARRMSTLPARSPVCVR